MTAVPFDDAAPTPPGRQLARAPAPGQPAKRLLRLPIGPGSGDPLVDAATRLLSIPLRQLYAVLWRAGVIEVRA
jgi:hypothetical protein